MKVVHPTGVRIATLSGAIILLEAGVETPLPAFLATLALGHGAQIVDGEQPAEQEPAPAAPAMTNVEIPQTIVKVPVQSDHDKLVAIMKDMLTRASAEEFRQDGQPKNAVLNRLFGKVVTEELRTPAWAEATKII